MSLPKHKYTKLRLNEVSVVDAGANQFAKVVIAKRAKKQGIIQKIRSVMKMDYTAKTTGEILQSRELSEKLWKVREAFGDSIWDIMYSSSGTDQIQLLRKTVDEFAQEMEKVLPGIEKKYKAEVEKILDSLDQIDHVLASDVGDCGELTANSRICISKNLLAIGCKDTSGESQSFKSEGSGMDVQKALQVIADQEATIEDRIAAQKVLKATIKPLEPEATVEKNSLDPEVRAFLERIEKRAEAAEKANSLLATKLEKLEREKADTVALQKANEVAIPGLEAAELVPLVKKLSDEEFAALKRLTAASKEQGAVLKLLTSEVGAAGFEGDSVSAEDRLDAMARKAMKEDRGLSYEKAVSKVLETDDGLELYNEMELARQAAAIR